MTCRQQVTFDGVLEQAHWMRQAMPLEILLSPTTEGLEGTQVFRGQRREIDHTKRTVGIEIRPEPSDPSKRVDHRGACG